MFFRKLAFLLLFLPLFLCAAQAQETSKPAVAAESPGAEGVVVPLRYNPPRIPAPIIRASVNGAKPANFIVDTGSAFILALTPEYAHSLKLKQSAEKVQVNKVPGVARCKVQSLSLIGDKEVSIPLVGAVEAIIVDAHLSDMMPHDTPVAGVIGLPLFGQVLAQFDWPGQKLMLYPGSTIDTSSIAAQAFDFVPLSGNVFGLRFAPLQGKSIVLVLDTGSVLTGLPRPLFQSLPATASKTARFQMMHGRFWQQEKIVADFMLGTLPVKEVAVDQYTEQVGDGDGILGMNVLSRFYIVLDVKHHKVYFSPNGASFNMQNGTVGATLKKTAGHLQVAVLRSGYPAAKSGIRVGDTLHSVDDVAMAGEAYLYAQQIIDGTAGTMVLLELEHTDHTRYKVFIERKNIYTSLDGKRRWSSGLTAQQLNGKPLEVKAVESDTPLARAGVRPGDFINAINGSTIAQLPNDALNEIWDGDKVTLKITRKGTAKPLFLTVSDSNPQSPTKNTAP